MPFRTTQFSSSPPTTTDKNYSPQEAEFLLAVEDYQKRTGRKFPSYSELYGLLTRGLGYSRNDRPFAGDIRGV